MDQIRNGFSVAIQGVRHVYKGRTKEAAQEEGTS